MKPTSWRVVACFIFLTVFAVSTAPSAGAVSAISSTDCIDGRMCISKSWNQPGSTGTNMVYGFRAVFSTTECGLFTFDGSNPCTYDTANVNLYSFAYSNGGGTVAMHVQSIRNRNYYDVKTMCIYTDAGTENEFLAIYATYSGSTWVNTVNGQSGETLFKSETTTGCLA